VGADAGAIVPRTRRPPPSASGDTAARSRPCHRRDVAPVGQRTQDRTSAARAGVVNASAARDARSERSGRALTTTSTTRNSTVRWPAAARLAPARIAVAVHPIKALHGASSLEAC
jgi:hypothetical protein